MRFITTAEVQNFQGYGSSQRFDLGDVTCIAGPNNAGKSALLNSLRRLVSHDPSRGGHEWNSDTEIPRPTAESAIVVDDDHRDTRAPANPRISFTLDGSACPGLGVEGILQTEARFPTRAERAQGQIVSQVKGLAQAIQALRALPVVVLPERRDRTGPAELAVRQRPFDSFEKALTEDGLLPLALEWKCADGHHWRAWQDLASHVFADEIVLTIDPVSQRLRVRIGQTPARPLESLGAGVGHVLLFAAALTRHVRALLLYEEPEQHLHPRIQRVLMDQLVTRCTDPSAHWQAIVTTHSNHVLNLGVGRGMRRFEVTRAGDESRIRSADGDRLELLRVLESLGVRPESVLAANTVIWVEGPSDAIYLGYFLRERARATRRSVAEHVDYSFAFFGGSNLASVRLSALPSDRLVDLFSVHPRSYVVFDSDRASVGTGLGKPYADAFAATALAGRVWITEGREVENYLADPVLAWAATGECTKNVRAAGNRDFDVFAEQVQRVRRAHGRKRARHDVSDAAKAQFARDAVGMMASRAKHDWLDRLDLRTRVDELLRFICCEPT